MNTMVFYLDLTSDFDIEDLLLLLSKLERIGVRNLSHKLLSNYLPNRSHYIEIQGKTRSLRGNPDTNVIQGLMLLGTLFTL